MIYLDYQATTPLAPEAREAMLQWLGGPESEGFANPHSPHRMGRMAKAAIELAREEVAALLPAGGKVIFTGNACEAINLAMRGSVSIRKPGLAMSNIEHAAVYDTARALGGADILAADANGLVRPEIAVPEGTGLVCVMAVNNEVGTVQRTAAWAKAAHAAGALYLCDAVQGYGKFDLTQVEADFIAISAHKIYGPKGIGALWVRDGIALDPQVTGGLQEGLRSGTLSPALVAGFGAAARVARERWDEDRAHVEALWHRARELFAGWQINGDLEHRNHGNLSIRRDGLDVARLMSECREVMFSAGSACASGSGKTSHVLRAIGLTDAQARSTIRIGYGRYTRMEALEAGAARLNELVGAQYA